MATNDAHIDRYDSHVTKLFDRLDNAMMDSDIKDYSGAVLNAGQAVLRLIAMRKETEHADTGSKVREYADTFAKNATDRRKTDRGKANPDADAIERQLDPARPDHTNGELSDAGVRN